MACPVEFVLLQYLLITLLLLKLFATLLWHYSEDSQSHTTNYIGQLVPSIHQVHEVPQVSHP